MKLKHLETNLSRNFWYFNYNLYFFRKGNFTLTLVKSLHQWLRQHFNIFVLVLANWLISDT